MRNRLLLSILIILVCFTTVYSQNGTRSVDYSTRSFGRGGTSIGLWDSPSLLLSNPGGLSYMKNSELTANGIFMIPGYTFINYKKDASGNTTATELNNSDGEKNLYVLPSISYIHKFKDSKFTLGVGFFTTGGMGAEYNLNHELFKDASGNYVQKLYKSNFAVMEAPLTVSYKIIPELSIGLTAELVYSQLEFINPFSLPPDILKGTAMPGMTFGQLFSMPRTMGGLGYSELTSYAEMNELNTFSYGGKIGVAYKVNDKFSLGASYSLPIPLKFTDGKAKLDMTDQFNDASFRAVQNVMARYPGITIQQARDSVLHQFIAMGINPANGFEAEYSIDNEFEMPQSFGFGIGYAPMSTLRFGFDFEWINWSKALDQMDLTLRNGTNSNINKMLSKGGTGQEELKVPFLLKWKDAVLLKFGGEYDFSKKFTLRLGYSYGTNPIPPETIIPVIPTVIEHHIMGGFTFNIIDKFAMNMALEWAVKNDVTGTNPHLIASEYINSKTGLENFVGHLSFTYGF